MQASSLISDKDILCGRGKGLESFPGNKSFRKIIKEHAKIYGRPTTKRAERSRLVNIIFHQLHSAEGMRFVRREKGNWVTLNVRDSKSKIGHALRDAAVEKYKKQNVQAIKSSLSSTGLVASIISDDESECETDDHFHSFTTELLSTQQEKGIDRIRPGARFKKRITDPLIPRISFETSCLNYSTAGETTDLHNPKRDELRHLAGFKSNPMYYGMKAFDSWDTGLSSVYLNFIEDQGDDVTDEVSSINPLDWTLDNQALVMKTAL